MSDITEFLQSQRRDLTTAISESDLIKKKLGIFRGDEDIEMARKIADSLRDRLIDSLALTENAIRIDGGEERQQIGEGATVESPDGTKWKVAVFCDSVTFGDMEMRVESAEKDT